MAKRRCSDGCPCRCHADKPNRITDKVRLDFIFGKHDKYFRWEEVLNIYWSRKVSPRQAVDAAIRAERKSGEKERR